MFDLAANGIAVIQFAGCLFGNHGLVVSTVEVPKGRDLRRARRWNWRVTSRDNGLDDVGLFDAGEAEIETLGAAGEAFVVDAEEAQDGGVEVADMDGIADDVPPHKEFLDARPYIKPRVWPCLVKEGKRPGGD